MTATMALNAAGHRSDHGLASHLIQWWKEWRASVLGLLAGIAFAALVIMPLTFVLGDTVNGEFPIMSHDELGHEVARVIDLLKQPVRRDGMETYFETISAKSATDAQCRYLHRIMPMVFVDTRHPCYRLERDGSFLENNFFMQYHNAFGPTEQALEVERYYGRHSEKTVDNRMHIMPVITIWHPEMFLKSYLGGVLWTFLMFLYRSNQSGRCVALDVVSPRFWLQSLFWVKTLWKFYPGNAWQQMKEAARSLGYLLAVAISFASCGMAKVFAGERRDETEDLTPVVWSLGGSLQTAYVIFTGKVVDPSWSFQPWVRATLFDACYLETWTNIGLEYKRVDEVDLTAGCVWKNGHMSLDMAYSHYFFPPSSTDLYAPKVTACWLDVSLCGNLSYLSPNGNAPAGMQFGLWKDDVWTSYGVGTQIGFYHTRNVYGMRPVTVFRPKISLPLTFWRPLKDLGVTLFVTGSIPLNRTGEGNDNATVFGGFQFAF